MIRLLKYTGYGLLALVWSAILAYVVAVIWTFRDLVNAGSQWWAMSPVAVWNVLRPGFLKQYIVSSQDALIAGAAFIVALGTCVWITLAIFSGKQRVLEDVDPGNGPILLSDAWLETTADSLGYRALAKSVAYTIMRSADKAPFAVAIEGRWGVGKTTLMKMIAGELRDKRFPVGNETQAQQWTAFTIWFNPWRHRKRDAQRAFMNAVFADIPWRALSWYFGPVMRGRVIAQIANLASFIRGQSAMGARLSNRLDVRVGYRDKFQEDFEGFLHYWSRVEGKTQIALVIFIDDLDRCAPTDIAPILESMKLFFENRRCIFVLGFDPHFVAESIRREYQGLVPDGLKYLQKLVQVEFPLLQSRDTQLESLLDKYVASSRLTAAFKVIEMEVNDYRQLMLKYTHRTPREIKRVINSMALMIPLHQPSEYANIFYLLLLQAHWRSVYDELCGRLQQGNIAGRTSEIVTEIQRLQNAQRIEQT